MLSINSMEIKPFQKKLLSWYQKNKRSLPWRLNQEPYRVWISEIMLQQTQVQTVIPYYEKFLKRFPTVHALANAEEEDVLSHWAGLGYYRRARQLHACAKTIAEQKGVPNNAKDWQQFPGIGPYTAAAIASIALNEPIAVVDGNVIRVISRLHALAGHAKSPSLKLSVTTIAQTLIDPNQPGDFNQAMMELGATVCTPHLTQCSACPVHIYCKAYQLDQVGTIPAVPPQKIIKQIHRTVLVIMNQQKVLIQKRPANAKWLPQFYAPLEWWDTAAPNNAKQWAMLLASSYLNISSHPIAIGKTKHTITNHHIISSIYGITTNTKLKAPARHQWVPWEALDNKAIANLDAKVFNLVSKRPLLNSVAFK